MGGKTTILLALFMAVSLAGCTGSNTANGQQSSSEGGGDNDAYNFAGNGQWNGEIERDTLDCDDDGRLSFAGNGQGSISVRVTDGNGAEIGDFEFSGQGQGYNDEALDGAAGTWTVVVEAGSSSMPFGFGYQGQYSGRVSC